MAIIQEDSDWVIGVGSIMLCISNINSRLGLEAILVTSLGVAINMSIQALVL